MIILGNCMDAMDSIKSQSVDMILTDLPYGVTNHAKDVKLNLDELWVHYKRVAKANAAFVFTSQFPFSAELYMSNPKWFRYDLVWDKVLPSGHLNANRMPLRVHEQIMVFYAKLPTYNPQFYEGKPLHSQGKSTNKVTHNNYGKWTRLEDVRRGDTKRHPQSIVKFPKPHASCALHRTEKPVSLFEWLIKTYTNEGDLVLDSCCGSGTTGVAAKKNNRRFIIIDNDPACIEVSKRRLS